MRLLTNILTLTLLAALSSVASADENGTETIALFNGKNLDGWKVFAMGDNVPDDLWTVRDGMLVTIGKPIGFIHTTDKYEDYKLVVEWRWPEGKEPGNSGVLLRINGEPVAFMPPCVEAQLKSGNAGDLYGFIGASIDGPEDRLKQIEDHKVLGDFTGVPRMKTVEKPVGQWNRYEITIEDKKISVTINGEKINEAWGLDEVAGPIGLQSEGAEIHFRKVELTPLK